MVTQSVPQIFSPQRRRERWRRALARQGQADAADFVFRALADELEDRLGFTNHVADRALLIGDPTGLAAEVVRRRCDALQLASPLDFDEEAPIAGAFGLIASLGAIDTVNDVPGALVHIREALAPGGIAIVGFLAAGSLPNLRRALLAADGERPAARMHPMIDIRSASALLQRAGFARQVADSFTLRVRYGSLDRLVDDLRDQALTNVLASSPPPLTHAGLERARTAFLNPADDDGRVTETFEIVTLTGWKD